MRTNIASLMIINLLAILPMLSAETYMKEDPLCENPLNLFVTIPKPPDMQELLAVLLDPHNSPEKRLDAFQKLTIDNGVTFSLVE